jgi:hypothetical protein
MVLSPQFIHFASRVFKTVVLHWSQRGVRPKNREEAQDFLARARFRWEQKVELCPPFICKLLKDSRDGCQILREYFFDLLFKRPDVFRVSECYENVNKGFFEEVRAEIDDERGSSGLQPFVDRCVGSTKEVGILPPDFLEIEGLAVLPQAPPIANMGNAARHVRELLKYSYPLPDRKGEKIAVENLLTTIETYLVDNGPLAMRGYRKKMFENLRQDEMPRLVEDIMQGRITKAHESGSMEKFNRLDHRMRVICDCVREADEYLQECEHLKTCEALMKQCSLTPEGILEEPWTLLMEVDKAQKNAGTEPNGSSPERASRSLSGTFYHCMMETKGIDYRTYLARRPALVGADVGFRAAMGSQRDRAPPGSENCPKQFTEFLRKDDMLERLGELPKRFIDRLEANTDPLQKAEALCRVFRQLRKKIAVQVEEIPKTKEDAVLSRFLAEFNPPGLLTNFVYLYEFLFAPFSVEENDDKDKDDSHSLHFPWSRRRAENSKTTSAPQGSTSRVDPPTKKVEGNGKKTGIDLNMAPGASEHELKWLQRFLSSYFHRPLSSELFRLVRTQPETYDVVLFKFNASGGNTGNKESVADQTLKSWLGLSQGLPKGLEEFVVEFQKGDYFTRHRVRARIFPNLARPVDQKFEHIITWCDDQAELARFMRIFRQTCGEKEVIVLKRPHDSVGREEHARVERVDQQLSDLLRKRQK